MRIAASAAWICVAALAGCTASSDEVHPPPDELFFPSGMAVYGNALFVANANSELRFDSGSISVIDIARVRATIADWRSSGGNGGAGDCEGDPDHSETLICDEAFFMNPDAGVRIGNFATDLALQVFDGANGGGGVRVFSPTRGDPSVAWADYVNGALTCGPSEPFGLCDDAHRLSQINNDPDADPIPDEPFGVFADGPNGFAAVTHLSTGGVTLISSPDPNPRDGNKVDADVRVVDVRAGFFFPDSFTNLAGTSGIAGRRPSATGTDDILYVGSNTDHRVQTFTVGQSPVTGAVDPVTGLPDTRAPEASYLVPGSYFILTNVGTQSGGSLDTRGMKFSDDGNQLFLVNRNPPSLQIYDTSLGPTGAPRNQAAGGMDICRQASTLASAATPLGTRVYVTCFQDGVIYVIDPQDLDQPEDIVQVGIGPYSVVSAPDAGAPLLFVSNFLEDTIAVIDANPSSITYDRVVLRIGKPKAPSQ